MGQFRWLPENEETMCTFSSDSEEGNIENDEDLEATEIDPHFRPPSEDEYNPISESEDVEEKPCDAGISNA